MEAFLLAFGTFLVQNPAIVNALVEAIEGGVTHTDLLAAIKGAQASASEAAVVADLGPRKS